jgi:hypothetical protein
MQPKNFRGIFKQAKVEWLARLLIHLPLDHFSLHGFNAVQEK